MLVLDNKLELTPSIMDETQVRINPEYETYIKQLEHEVKILRQFVKISKSILEDNGFKRINSLNAFIPPQTPEWKG
jgi:ferritin